MRPPALVPAHVPLAEAARIAERHGFVLETVLHDGRVRIAMVRRPRADGGSAAVGARTGGVTAPVATADSDRAPSATSDDAAAQPTAEDGAPTGDR
jgi:hypothetical protein